jgi:hypothetical protein
VVAPSVRHAPDQPARDRRHPRRRTRTRLHPGARRRCLAGQRRRHPVVLSHQPAVSDTQSTPGPAPGRRSAGRRRARGACARRAPARAHGFFKSLGAYRRRTSRVVLRLANRPVADGRRSGQRVPERRVLPGEVVRRTRRGHRPVSGRRVLLQLVRLQRNRLQQGVQRRVPLPELPARVSYVQRRCGVARRACLADLRNVASFLGRHDRRSDRSAARAHLEPTATCVSAGSHRRCHLPRGQQRAGPPALASRHE